MGTWMANKYGITLDDAISEIQVSVKDAINWVAETYEEDWETAERYMAGDTDLPETAGRSNVVRTEVRDAIRTAKPSVMRTLLHARKIVEYQPEKIQYAAWTEQQSIFATQLFWKNNGYSILVNLFEEAAKLKAGILKTYWMEDPLPTYFHYSKVTSEVVQGLEANPELDIEEINPIEPDEDADMGVPFYEIKGYQYAKNGRIVMESIPIYEFFIDEASASVSEAIDYGVHGHTREVTVAEAIELGLDYPNWEELDSEDIETARYAGKSYAARGYAKDKSPSSGDLSKKLILLTEAYARFDLKGSGRPQLYRFWLGGTGYEYIDHEEVEESPFDIANIDPVPYMPFGRSIADITIKEQDTNTSLLRATVDNAHAANNPRHAADPVRTKFEDLINPALGAPIRTRGEPAIQTVSIPFTGQGMLPLLEYLNRDVQEKVGVTKAAQGLDPNAMQSTDKDAVRNTIALSQGQIELMVRNLVETCLIPAFRKLLRLSLRHGDPIQHVQTKGQFIPVLQTVFDPDLVATPNVGLGTASPEQKMQGLGFVLQKQEQIIAQFGFDNPFTSLSQIYNTLEDMTELSGMPDVGRYFKVVTPQIEQQLAQQRQQQAQQQAEEAKKNQPMDPSKAMMVIENGKARVKQMEIMSEQRGKEMDLQERALNNAMQNDLKRDELIQNRVLKLVELRANQEEKRITRQQEANDDLRERQAKTPNGG